MAAKRRNKGVNQTSMDVPSALAVLFSAEREQHVVTSAGVALLQVEATQVLLAFAVLYDLSVPQKSASSAIVEHAAPAQISGPLAVSTNEE